MNILQAISDPAVFAPHYAVRVACMAFLAALFGLPLTPPQQLELYRACTGRSAAPTSPLSEAWLVCGRRSGKSFTLALIAVFLACFRDWRRHLGPGERGTVICVIRH